MPQDKIVVVGAREHNLKNITVKIPRDKLVMITGISGSGKSSLAFDTIFAEGQRRYVESLSAYARQFLGQLEKPDVDHIDGLSPAVSIDQKGVSKNPRSTVGTVTEIYDYLRLLFARVGIPHCPKCWGMVNQQSAQEIVDAICTLPDASRIILLAPLVKDRKGQHHSIFKDIRKSGFVRIRVDGEVYDVQDPPELDRYKTHTIEAVVDRLVIHTAASQSVDWLDFITRLTDSVETALRLGDGMILVQRSDSSKLGDDQGSLMMFSEHFACAHCNISMPDFEPRSFSFNSPHGACPECQGLGRQLEIDSELIIPDRSRTLENGAIAVMEWRPRETEEGGHYWRTLQAACSHYSIPMDSPIEDLAEDQINVILYGSKNEKVPIEYTTQEGRRAVWNNTFEGVINNLRRRYTETNSEYIRSKISFFMRQHDCETCHLARLRPESLAVTIGESNIVHVTRWPVTKLLKWVKSLDKEILTKKQRAIASQILKEIDSRLKFMANVGLDYLTMDRLAGSLSGGEAQRIRLATQIGSQLTGVLYVLDEPSIGLHQRDNARLLNTLKSMRDLGNTLLVVEHDHEAILAADWIVDLGPGAGSEGGNIVAEGTVREIMAHPKSITGAYLANRISVPLPETRREGSGDTLVIRGARQHNLKNIDVIIPLGTVTCITGVSGSGKSTLINEVLYRSVAKTLHNTRVTPGKHDSIDGLHHIDKIINVDQSPIGRTPRSNPGTYIGLFDEIRKLFAELPESKIRGYKPGRYSFNVKGGRCETCQGQGKLQIEMQFLPDIYVTCELCKGERYNRETLQVRFKDLTISDVLNTSIKDAVVLFENFPRIQKKLDTLLDVGLGYVKIGQPATTLSGGEAQRVKLSKELSRRATGRTLYVLDEPSVGLHAADVHRLMEVMHHFVDQGNTVVIIEHNPDIIKTADHIVDLGPEGGDRGGYLVAAGTPEELVHIKTSYTGQFLVEHLHKKKHTERNEPAKESV